MGNLRAIGFGASRDDLERLARLAAQNGAQLAAADGTITHVLDDDSGAQLVVVRAPTGQLVCAKPAFRSSARLSTLRITHVVQRDCPHCDVVMLETEHGTPIPTEIATTALHRAQLGRSEIEVRICVFAESPIEVWESTSAFAATKSLWSSKSLVPLGMFGGEAPVSRLTLHGAVIESQQRVNRIDGLKFWVLSVVTLEELELDVVVDPSNCAGDFPPAPGSIVKVTGWSVASCRTSPDGSAQPATAASHRFVPTVQMPFPAGWSVKEYVEMENRTGDVTIVVSRQSAANGRSDPKSVAEQTQRDLQRWPGHRLIDSRATHGLGRTDGWRTTHLLGNDLLQIQHIVNDGIHVFAATYGLRFADPNERDRSVQAAMSDAASFLSQASVRPDTVASQTAHTSWFEHDVPTGWALREEIRASSPPHHKGPVDVWIDVTQAADRPGAREELDLAANAPRPGYAPVGESAPATLGGLEARSQRFEKRRIRGRSSMRAVDAAEGEKTVRLTVTAEHGRRGLDPELLSQIDAMISAVRFSSRSI